MYEFILGHRKGATISETDEMVQRRQSGAWTGLSAINCIGETLAREGRQTRQLFWPSESLVT